MVAERYRAKRGEGGAIALIPVIFSDGISEKTWTRKMTREQADKYFGGTSTLVYRMSLCNNEARSLHCRLCAIGTRKGG